MEFPTLTPKWKSNGKPQTATGSRQHSLHEGEEIFKLISSKIESANKSVYVAASWFTDLDLFDALERRAQQNPQLVIKIVLDNNQSNYYLPFKKLVDIGAVVRMKKVKSSYGSMHSKYCIIDEASLISGSYNWSKNARNNNEENIIYTEDPQLVAQYLDKFNQLLESSEDFDPDNINKVEDDHPETASETNDIDKNIQDYEALLDKLIYAQVHSYDDLELRAMGKERCLNCSGFAGNVPQELDNVYTHFLRDIKVSNEKKELIKSSLFEQLERSKGTLDLKSQNEIALLEKETRLANEQIDREMTVTKSELVIVETEIENLTQGDKSKFTDEIAAYNGKIDELKRNSFRPKIAWYSFIPNILFLFLVVAYCIIFYSSAAYILIFSQEDARTERLTGGTITDPEIFDGDAIVKSLERGWVSAAFILLVPVFIMGLIFVLNKIENKWGRYSLLVLMMIFVDGFTAYKVAESIYNIEYLKGDRSEPWEMGMVWVNSNFYLVFVFGLLALLTFEFLLGHFIKVLDDRNKDIQYLKSIKEIEASNNKIVELKEQLAQVNSEINDRKAVITNYKEDLLQHEKAKQSKEAEKERLQHNITEQCNYQKSVFENVTHISITRIENENFTFSTVYMLERIAIFMGGWTDALFDQFSVHIAERKSIEADAQVMQWRTQNLKSTNNQ